MIPKTNPISVQSKQMIQDAMVSLLSKHNFKEITISDLSQEAGLSRRTFYRHYQSKEEVLSEIFQALYQDYFDVLKSKQAIKLPDITETFFSFFALRSDFLTIIYNNNLTHLFLKKMNQFIPLIYDALKGDLNEYEDKETLKYALTFSIGGHFNLLMLWIKENKAKTPSEIKSMIQKILNNPNLKYI